MSTAKTWLCGPAAADFKAAEQSLRGAGKAPVYGPHDIALADSATPDDRARARLHVMTSCDALCLVDGWSSDPAAEFEHSVAKRLGMRCTPLVILLSAGA